MKKKFFNSLFFVVILFCFGACDENTTFSLSLGENVFLLEPTVIDTKKVPEGINITVFVLIPDDKILDRFEVNNVEKELENGDVYKFRMSSNTNISASLKGVFSLELDEGISVIEPDKLDLDKIEEGERLTIRAEVDSIKAVESFKFDDDTEISEFDYKLVKKKIYVETSFIIEKNSSIKLKYSDELKIPPINFYKREGDDVLLLRKESKFNQEKVLIPNFVSIIEEEAFFEDSIVESVFIPDSVKSIESSAFSSCSNLDSIDIPKSVISFGGSVFDSTPWLENKLLANNGLAIVNNILISSDKTKNSFEIPSGIIGIASNSFKENSVLTDIIIPNGVRKIGSYAFARCSNLESITIPDSVEIMEVGIFSSCTSLISVVIPNGVTSVEASLFSGCKALSSVVIPDSVISIGQLAFNYCRSLSSIIIPKGVTSMERSVFISCSDLSTIYCRASDPSPEAVPDGWDEEWKIYCDATVVWGYTGD